MATREFTAIGLHDWYAAHWTPQYASLLADLSSIATLRTFDEIAHELFLAAAA